MNKECQVLASTIYNREEMVVKGAENSRHYRPPNRKEGDAEIIKHSVKRHTDDHPDVPPAQTFRQLPT